MLARELLRICICGDRDTVEVMLEGARRGLGSARFVPHENRETRPLPVTKCSLRQLRVLSVPTLFPTRRVYVQLSRNDVTNQVSPPD